MSGKSRAFLRSTEALVVRYRALPQRDPYWTEWYYILFLQVPPSGVMAYEAHRYAATALLLPDHAWRGRSPTSHHHRRCGILARAHPPPPLGTRTDASTGRAYADDVHHVCQPLCTVYLRHHFRPGSARHRDHVPGSRARCRWSGHWPGAAGLAQQFCRRGFNYRPPTLSGGRPRRSRWGYGHGAGNPDLYDPLAHRGQPPCHGTKRSDYEGKDHELFGQRYTPRGPDGWGRVQQ